ARDRRPHPRSGPGRHARWQEHPVRRRSLSALRSDQPVAAPRRADLVSGRPGRPALQSAAGLGDPGDGRRAELLRTQERDRDLPGRRHRRDRPDRHADEALRMSAGRATQLAIALLLGPLLGCSEDPGGDTEAETAGAEAETGDHDETGETGDPGDGDGDGDDEGDGDGDDTETDPGPQGVFVAVGDGGRRASSTDGLAWDEIIGSGVVDTQAETGEEDILRAVAVGDGVIVAVGGGGNDWNGNAMIMRSTDGVTWEEDLL